MTDLEQEFVLKCLGYMKGILNNPSKLSSYIDSFTQGKAQARYSSDAYITQGNEWSENERLQFNSAFFEATASTETALLTKNPERVREVTLAKEFFNNHYLFTLTMNVDPKARLAGVMANIEVKLSEINDEGFTKKLTHYAQENPSTFFSAAFLVATAAVTTAALISMQK